MSEASDALRKAFKEGDDQRDAGLTTPEDIIRFNEISYGPEPYWQTLDVYKPKAAADAVLPVIISIHGGGWVYGDKERYQYYCMSLAQRGFAVVNFTYRLAPDFLFPAGFEDTNTVAAWVMDNAAQYGFDTDHIFAVGDSAGGQMLGLYAAITTNPELAARFPFTVPEGFAFTAIGLNCGVYKFERTDAMLLEMTLMKDLLPGQGTDEELELMSVVNHITSDYPPTLVMTSTGDMEKMQAPNILPVLFEKNVPHVFLYCGTQENQLPHVFHCNMKLAEGAKCNDAECDYFKSFL